MWLFVGFHVESKLEVDASLFVVVVVVVVAAICSRPTVGDEAV